MFVSENIDTVIPKEKQTDHIYSLYGVVVHAGKSSGSGHYFSYVKKDNKWYRCNDDSVSEVNNIDQVLQQRAYLLFYQYRAPKPKESNQKVSTPLGSNLALNKTKSISVEINETLNNKHRNTMPLSGYIEDAKEVNSDEEEEKLVQKEHADEKKTKAYDYMDYVLQNFEDVNLDDIKGLGKVRVLI